MIRFSFVLLTLSLLFLACNNTSPAAAEDAVATSPAEAQTAAPAAAPKQYPSISEEQMRTLWDNCDYIDFVFYSTNFSMSQNQQPAIRTTLQGVSTNVATVKPTCQPAGRIFFQVDGVNASEADIFLGPDCFYYIFLENGQYAYANMMTDKGVEFYQNIFAQVKTSGG